MRGMLVQIRLRERADRDLIEWLQSVPPGDRSHRIRDALRLYIRLSQSGWPPVQVTPAPAAPAPQPQGMQRDEALEGLLGAFDEDA